MPGSLPGPRHHATLLPVEDVTDALAALRAAPLRSGLTTLGILIGVAAVIVVIAISNGAKAIVAAEIRSLGTNVLLVTPGSARQGALRLGAGSDRSLTVHDAQAIETEIGAAFVSAPTLAGGAQLVRGARNWTTLIGGVVPEYLLARDWSIEGGRPISQREAAFGAKVALIGRTVARELFAVQDPIGGTIRIEGAPFTVVGLLAEKGRSASGRDQDDVVLVPLGAARTFLPATSGADRLSVDYIVVKVAEARLMQSTEQRIRRLLRQRHQIPQGDEDDFLVLDPIAAMETGTALLDSLGLLVASVAAISLVVGGVTIANMMLVSIVERFREIGVAMAVGARPSDIRRQFLMEAAVIAALGGLGGIVTGGLVAGLFAFAMEWDLLLGVRDVGLAMAMAVAVGLLAGLYPAVAASRIDPIEAIRME